MMLIDGPKSWVFRYKDDCYDEMDESLFHGGEGRGVK